MPNISVCLSTSTLPSCVNLFGFNGARPNPEPGARLETDEVSLDMPRVATLERDTSRFTAVSAKPRYPRPGGTFGVQWRTVPGTCAERWGTQAAALANNRRWSHLVSVPSTTCWRVANARMSATRRTRSRREGAVTAANANSRERAHRGVTRVSEAFHFLSHTFFMVRCTLILSVQI